MNYKIKSNINATVVFILSLCVWPIAVPAGMIYEVFIVGFNLGQKLFRNLILNNN